jgi:arylsulfatase A-like enzyme
MTSIEIAVPRKFWLVAAALTFVAAMLFGRGESCAAADRRPPNIVVILVDDLGWADLGCYGNTYHETPSIDRLASQGMRFTNGYAACTVCSPTRAAMLTGRYPARLHVTDWIAGHNRPNAPLAIPDWTKRLVKAEVTLAEALAAAGYVTAHIGKWHLGGEGHAPSDQGFDVAIGGDHRGQPPSYFSPYGIPAIADGPKGEFLTDRESAEAVKFIAANKDKPFLLCLWHYAVHTPLSGKAEVIEHYKAKARREGLSRNATYAALVDSVDQSTGRILATLDEHGLTQNTIVAFTSDNGGLVLRDVTTNAPLRSGKGSPYEGGHRVAFIVRWPNVVAPGTTSDVPVTTVDFFPTLLAAAGVDPPKNVAIDGVDLAPILKRSGSIDRDALYWHYPHYHPGGATPYSAIRRGKYKLIEYFEDRPIELYDLAADEGEQTNLAESMPDVRQDLRDRLAKWREAVGAQLPTPNPNRKAGG